MITPDQIMALNPCSGWTRERVTDLIGEGVEPNELTEILIQSVKPDDARWLCSRILDHAHRVTWAVDCAERVLPIYEQQYPNDKRPRNAIEGARRDITTTTTAYATYDTDTAYDADAAYDTDADAADAAADAAYAAANTAYVGAVNAAYVGAANAANAANAASTYTAVDAAANAAYAAYAAVDTAANAVAAAADEYAWQIRRACRLLEKPQ